MEFKIRYITKRKFIGLNRKIVAVILVTNVNSIIPNKTFRDRLVFVGRVEKTLSLKNLQMNIKNMLKLS